MKDSISTRRWLSTRAALIVLVPLLSALALLVRVAPGLEVHVDWTESAQAETPDSGAVPGADKSKEASAEQFIRVARDQSGRQIALQTSVISFLTDLSGGPKNANVDLVSAVHIGESEYFSELNKLFKSYDVVLYELVAPKDIASTVNLQDRSNPLSSLQRGLTETLGLQFQLDKIDYTAKNFVHADLSPDEFVSSMKERGESGTSIAIRILAASLEQKKKENPLDSLVMLGLLFEADPAKKALGLKRILAEQTEDMETLIAAVNGSEGSTLITSRNERALKVLSDQLHQGRKRIAIYYGAAHMADLASALVNRLGFHRGETRWLDAWNLHG